jgi:hypothetical protein
MESVLMTEVAGSLPSSGGVPRVVVVRASSFAIVGSVLASYTMRSPQLEATSNTATVRPKYRIFAMRPSA